MKYYFFFHAILIKSNDQTISSSPTMRSSAFFIVQSSIHYTNLLDPSASILYFPLITSCTTLNDKYG